MKYKERTIEKKSLFKGTVIELEYHTVELCNGKEAHREIIRHKGGVAIVPVTENNEIYLVKQYRKPYDMELLEVPAGKLELEQHEDPQACAVRELQEETGLRAERITYLTTMYPSPGYTDEKIYIYKAEGLTQGSLSLDEDEFLDVKICTIKEAVDMVKKGVIMDAKSVIAILMLYNEIKS